jgi:hypothetical protein
MTDDLTDDQQAVHDALIATDAAAATVGVTEDKQAVAIEVGDASAYFAPHEVRAFGMAVARSKGGDLTDGQKQTITHAHECAAVVRGEQSIPAAAAKTDPDVVVEFPE